MRVLHVVEAMGGGTLSAVLTLADATPELDHHLVVWPRREHADAGGERAVLGGIHLLPAGSVAAVRALRATVRTLAPQVVHAHSSYAGMLVRAAGLDVRVAYSPHCFGFERRDLGGAGRTGVRLVERALVRRTDVLVACSPHEARLATGLGHRDVVLVPNRALHPTAEQAAPAAPGRPLRAVTVGRIGAQKDWRFLLEVKAAHERSYDAPVAWTWLGDGDDDGARALREAGIAVSGWLPREEVVHRLAAAQAYVHTAAWEAAPVSILEAAAAGLPVVARAIPTLESLHVPGLGATPADLAAGLAALHDPAAWAAAQTLARRFSARHTPGDQRAGLEVAYGRATAALITS